MNPVPLSAGAERLLHLPQEIPLEHPESSCRFRSPLYATRAAVLEFGYPTIVAHHRILVEKATRHRGLNRLQVFRDPQRPDRRLWFIEDGPGEAHVTALLPDDY